MNETLKEATEEAEKIACDIVLKFKFDGADSQDRCHVEIARAIAPLIAECAALQARVVEVEKERDKWRETAAIYDGQVIDAESSLATSRRRVEGLVEALKRIEDYSGLGCPVSQDTLNCINSTAAVTLFRLDAPQEPAGTPLAIDYTNWRGERRQRGIIPIRPFFGSNEWHKEPQWLLEAIDPEDGKTKTFAFAGMLREPTPDPRDAAKEAVRRIEASGPIDPEKWAETLAGDFAKIGSDREEFGTVQIPDPRDAIIAEAVEVMRPFKKYADDNDDVVAEDQDLVEVRLGFCDAARAFVEKHAPKPPAEALAANPLPKSWRGRMK